MSLPGCEVHADGPALATAVARALLARLRDVQEHGRRPQLSLTGGGIADRVHRRVADLTPGSGVDWGSVEVWWSDERYVPGDSPERNARQAREALLDHVAVDPARVHEMPAQDTSRSLEEAASAYAGTLRSEGADGFDVLMLGMGDDGHVASLFPGHPAVRARDAIAVGVDDSPKPPPQRITLTMEALSRSRAVWFLVSGAGKADAVARVQAGAPVEDVPASGVTGLTETRWFLDAEAASRIRSSAG